MNVIENFIGIRKIDYSLSKEIFQIAELETSSRLSFPLCSTRGKTCSPLVRPGDEIAYGQPLWEVDNRQTQPSPVKGKIANLANIPDIRARRLLPSVIVEAAAGVDAQLKPLDPDKTDAGQLKKRIDEAGVLTDMNSSDQLRMLFESDADGEISQLVILAVDREPGVTASIQQFYERNKDAAKAGGLLARMTGVSNIYLALPNPVNSAWSENCKENGVKVLPIKMTYPQSLDEIIIQQHQLAGKTVFINLETALDILDAITMGKIKDTKVVSVIGPEGNQLGNYRIKIGTPLKEILAALELKVVEKDKIIIGGPMRGIAQYSLDGVIDRGVDALMVIPKEKVIEWTGEPCINCGNCIDICPVNLQVQLIGRYSEFSIFERTRDLDIEQCIECGLCGTVCTARRPLLQLIDLAKKELPDLETGVKKADLIKTQQPQLHDLTSDQSITLPDNDPAMSIFSGVPKFLVGFAPHWRSKASITKMNLAFILALIPVVFASAVSQFFGPQASTYSGTLSPVSSITRSVLTVMGLGPGVLWFTGVLATVLIGMGMGVLIEYICQVLMRQPYYATNGHGALMGMIVAMLMPPSIPIWILFVAVLVAIFIGKQVFGGIGCYPMHPAMIGWLVVLLSWSRYVYPIGASSIASAHTAVIVVTIIMGLILWMLGFIRISIPIGVVIGVVVFSFILQGRLDGGVMDQLMTGHVFLAAFFLATDSTTSPANKLAMWIFGIGVGFLIILVRAFGIWPDAIPFAILLMNILFPLLDRIRPKVKSMAL